MAASRYDQNDVSGYACIFNYRVPHSEKCMFCRFSTAHTPKWAMAQMEPLPKWARAHRGPGPKRAGVQAGQGPGGPGPKSTQAVTLTFLSRGSYGSREHGSFTRKKWKEEDRLEEVRLEETRAMLKKWKEEDRLE